VAEIAGITGIGLSGARQRLRRGRMMLVTALARGRPAPQEGVPMRCWEARSQVSDYLDGVLAATTRLRSVRRRVSLKGLRCLS